MCVCVCVCAYEKRKNMKEIFYYTILYIIYSCVKSEKKEIDAIN